MDENEKKIIKIENIFKLSFIYSNGTKKLYYHEDMTIYFLISP